MKQWLLLGLMVWLVNTGSAQLTGGPMLGPSGYRNQQVWVMVEGKETFVEMRFREDKEKPGSFKSAQPVATPAYTAQTYTGQRILKFDCTGLEPGTAYQYEVSVMPRNGRTQTLGGQFKTLQLFQWRSNPPDINFLAGSCHYTNQPAYDRPGKPYGGDSSIFEPMAAEKADLMLWLGDNWYTRDVDYTTAYGLWYRPTRDRNAPILRQLLANTPQLAIWDDHDYGPNDYAKSFIHKETSRQIFESFWLNPSTGLGGQGIFTRYQLGDVDFFLMDDRWWRDFDNLPDSVNGKPNEAKLMWGKQQLEWLKDELRVSKGNPFVNFRIIATGSQVLNPVSPFDKLLAFPAEYDQLMEFLRSEKIDGVLFLTGDRHHSEIIKVQHDGLYPLFDITSSPLTSGTHKFGGKEADNPFRVLGVDQLQNYGHFKVTGPRNNRVMEINFKGLKGQVLGTYRIAANDLRFSRQ